MKRYLGICALFIFLVSLTPAVIAVTCSSGLGVTLIRHGNCESPATPSTGLMKTETPLVACTDYVYTGPAAEHYKFSGNIPFDVIITDTASTTKINIGNFVCDGGRGEQSHKYIIDCEATPEIRLSNAITESFSIQGRGSISFRIEDGTTCPAAECDNGWTEFNGKCFKAGYPAMAHAEAKIYCENARSGSTLASIASQEEEEFTQTNFGPSYIGLYDVSETSSPSKSDRDFKWDDGTPVTYTNWLAPDPNNHNGIEWCVINEWNGNKNWFDIYCTASFIPLCSYHL